MPAVHNCTVDYIDHMGDDLRVANAARVSFNKHKDEFDEKDAKLINYLREHNHWTPFGHCAASFRITAPIFVRGQLAKHTVGLVMNEVSRRYVDTEPDYYVPKGWRGRPLDKKQGSGGTAKYSYEVDVRYNVFVPTIINVYKRMLEDGVAPEQARMILPQSTMTSWYWTGSLEAFLRVCGLRLQPDAQEETREVATLIWEHLTRLWPVSCAAFMQKELKEHPVTWTYKNNEKECIITGAYNNDESERA